MLKYRRLLASLLSCLVLVSLLSVTPVIAEETEDSRIFLAGFNAYQKNDFTSAVTSLSDLLQKYPDTPLRDMTLFWLARSHYKAGNRQDAARFMAQFSREFPDNPLKQTVEEDLQQLAANYKPQTVVAQSSAAKAQAEEAARAAAARQAEQQRQAAVKAEQERQLAIKAEEERRKVAAAAAAAEQQRVAAAQAERQAREKAEAERLAAAQADEERKKTEAAAQAARQQAERQRLIAARAEEERLVRQKLEAERQATAQAEEERMKAAAAAAAAEQQRAAAAQAEAERQAREKAEAERLAAAKAEAERLAQEKAAADRLAQQKKEEAERQAAAEKAETERLARERAERLARATAEAEKLAAQKAAEQQAEARKAAAARAEAERKGMREKAIAEYKGIIERFPGSTAAQTAVNRLKAMGIVVAAPVVPPPQPNTQVLTLEVAQYAAFEFNPALPSAPVVVGQTTAIPFEITNRGNGNDSFYLASGFPAEFGVRFVADTNTEQAINQTPPLEPGAVFKGRMILAVPASTIDGLRISHPVKAASQFMADASQSRVVTFAASAPLMRAVVKTDKKQVMPGEKTLYRVTLLNVGSAAARDVTLRLNYPPQLEPAEPSAGGFRQEMKAALVLDGIQLKSGESREITVPFVVREDALAREELMVRADLISNPLQTRSAFLSNVVVVQPRSEVAINLAHSRITAIPGQTVLLPATVVNRGNVRESFSVVAELPASGRVMVYHDLNRDGIRQPNEPEVKSIGPLGPKEEAALLFEIATSGTAQDKAESGLSVSLAAESGQIAPVLASSRLIFSRPVLQLAMKGRGGRLVPGELLTVDLTVVNQGSNLARQVEVSSSWPDQMELVATEPSISSDKTGLVWRFAELGAGEKRIVKASFRARPTSAVGTGLQLKSELTYQDQLGNRY